MKSYRDYGIDCQDSGSGQRYCKCPQCGPTRTKKGAKCLSVNLDKGVWHCHHCDWSGHLEFTDAEKAEWGRARRAERSKAIQAPPGLPTMTDLSPRAVAWLQTRGIAGETASAAGCRSCVVFFAKTGRNAESLAIPFMRDGQAVNWKFRCIEDKDFSQQKGGQQCLYGFDDVRQRRTVILTEGELDALALREVDYEAVCSCPAGAPPINAQNITGKLAFVDDAREDVFDPADSVILAMDADEPGIRWRDAIAEKIGREKCYTVQYPQACKDANDVLVKHGRDALRDCIAAAAPYPVAGIATFSDYSDAIWTYYREGGASRGLSTGWANIDENFRLCPGSLNVVTGIPSSGKSEWLDQLMLLSCVTHNWRWAVYSPENQPPPFHFQKLAEKFSRKAMFPGWGPHMTERDVQTCIEYLSDRMRFITLDTGILTIDDILAKVKVCVARNQINGFLLDPYNEVEHCRPAGMSETEYVSMFLSKVRNFGRTHNVAMFIVAHPTKLQKNEDKQYPVPTPYDISGCYDDQTEVLTRRGWIRHIDVTEGDFVACFNTTTETLTYQNPIETHRYRYSGDMYHFRGYSFECNVTPEHRMVVGQTWRRKKPMKGTGMGRPVKYEDNWTFIKATDLASDLAVPIASPLTDAYHTPHGYFGMPVTEALEFIGWWIAEGYVTMKSLGICQADGPLARRISTTMHRAGLEFSEAVRESGIPGELPMWTARLFRREHADLCDWVMSTCGAGAGEKHIPEFIWELSPEHKTVFLNALLDGDGNRPNTRPGTARYATISKQLADDVMRLAVELGHHSSIASAPGAKPHHGTRYSVTIGRKNRNRSALRMKRHLRISHYDGEVFCLTVPTGAYVTRHNGEMMIAGNSAHWRNKADNCISVWRSGQEGDNSVQIHVQKVRDKNIGKTGCVVLYWQRSTGYFAQTMNELTDAPPQTPEPATDAPAPADKWAGVAEEDKF